MGPETSWQPAGHVMSQGKNVSFLKAVSWVKLESRREAGFFYTNYGQLWQSALARRLSLQHDIPLRPISPTTFHNRSGNAHCSPVSCGYQAVTDQSLGLHNWSFNKRFPDNCQEPSTATHNWSNYTHSSTVPSGCQAVANWSQDLCNETLNESVTSFISGCQRVRQPRQHQADLHANPPGPSRLGGF